MVRAGLRIGAWCMVRGVWCVVYGAWCMVRGVWCVVYGAWCCHLINVVVCQDLLHVDVVEWLT
jgi:hypothetical protein